MTTMMMKTLKFRAAQPEDRTFLMEWCNQLWNGEPDYIGDVWHEWVQESHLYVGTAPDANDPLTLLRLRLLTPHEAWFGGLRIHPSLQGQGIGQQLIAWAHHWARKQGATSIGYMTEGQNIRMHHLGEKFGYRTFGHVYWYQAPTQAAKLLDIRSDPELIDLNHQRLQKTQHGRYLYDWTLLKLTPERLRHHAAAEELLIHPIDDSWCIIRSTKVDVWVEYMFGNPWAIQELIGHALAKTHTEFSVVTPIWQHDPMLDQLLAHGWTLFPEFQFNVFEHNLSI